MEYTNEHGIAPSLEYIAEKVGLKESKVVFTFKWLQDILSLNATIGDNIYLEDIIGGYEQCRRNNQRSIIGGDARTFGKRPTVDREKTILELRYGLYDNKIHTLKEIGENLNITRERS